MINYMYTLSHSGGRGAYREVFIGGSLDINFATQRPPSNLNSVVERLYRSSDYDTPEFGEVTSFTQRLTGFFVPPVSCYYTFNLRSDDHSRLYLSQRPWTTELPDTPLINVPEHTRRRYVAYSCRKVYIYPIAGKLGRELNLAVWWSAFATAKLKCANISYLHIYMWQSHTEPSNLNIFAIVIWGPTAKFNSHQYFRLYGIAVLTLFVEIAIIDFLPFLIYIIWLTSY